MLSISNQRTQSCFIDFTCPRDAQRHENRQDMPRSFLIYNLTIVTDFYLKFDRRAVVDDHWWCHVAMLGGYSYIGVQCHGWGFHHRHHGDVDIVPHHERDRESREGEHIEHYPCRHHVWKREHVL